MSDHRAIVITTINYPTEAVKRLAKIRRDFRFIVVGDLKTPSDWSLDGVVYLSVERQREMGFAFSKECPPNHYARKNIGYLRAVADGARVIVETDDDNYPYDSFSDPGEKCVQGRPVLASGWINVYQYFTENRVWPRGFPLECIKDGFTSKPGLDEEAVFDCPVQQFLVDGNPDVDAVFRLTMETDVHFNPNTVILRAGSFCPFNSQNTVWWPEAYPLLYLPSYVSFRMTDIWRSFVAQICLYRMGKQIAFRSATMQQVRNEHSLIRDFEDEIPGYLNNARFISVLQDLPLSDGPDRVGENLRACYGSLAQAGIVPHEELHLVDLWLDDIRRLAPFKG